MACVLWLSFLVILGSSLAVADKVSVDLYYESQCPGCRAVLTGSFKEAYAAKGFLKMADISLFPYGNAKEDDGGPPYTWKCQHGPSECTYNLIEACAIEKIKCPYKLFQFINCIETHDESREPDQNYDAILNGCALLTDNADAADDIGECYTGDEGNALEHDIAVKTAGLSPPHTYVPWILVDGVHDDDVQDEVSKSLLAYVCKHYDGTEKSPDCPGQMESLRGSLGATSEEPRVCDRDAVDSSIQ